MRAPTLKPCKCGEIVPPNARAVRYERNYIVGIIECLRCERRASYILADSDPNAEIKAWNQMQKSST